MVASPTRSSKAATRVDFFTHPSEEELIAAYLLPRVSDNKPCPFIHEADVYSLDPADLTNHFAPAVSTNGDRAWYFFSSVRAKSREGQRKARTVGEGCWHSEAGAKPVVDVEPRRRRLGHRQSFSFVTKADGRRVRSGWLMVELGLNGSDEMVLCKIYFSPRAHQLTGATAAGRKRKADDDDDEDENPAPVRQRSIARTAEAPHASDDDDREELRVLDHVDRPDAEIRDEVLGLEELYGLLDSPIGKEPPPFPSYDAVSDRAYPACIGSCRTSSARPIGPGSRYNCAGNRRGIARSEIDPGVAVQN